MKPPRVFKRLPADEPEPPKGLIVRGICDKDEGNLYINLKQSDKEKLQSTIHECLHYIYQKLSEKKVERDCILIGGAVWKMGYRSKHAKEKEKKK